MKVRTCHAVMTFRRAFFMSGIDDALPAGAYEVATAHELMESDSFLAYRRIAATIRLPGGPDGNSRIVDVDPLELDALAEWDARHDTRQRSEQSSGANPASATGGRNG